MGKIQMVIDIQQVFTKMCELIKGKSEMRENTFGNSSSCIEVTKLLKILEQGHKTLEDAALEG